MADYNANIAPFINQTFYVTSEFWEPRSDGQGGTRYHKGLDIAVPMETATTDVYMYSMCNGTCIYRGYDADGYGNYFILKDSVTGLGFLYAHERIPNWPPIIDEGDNVVIGQAVGLQGSTGASTGPHLHLEMQDISQRSWRYNGNFEDYINPAEWMGFPNTEGISVFYDGVPIFPPEEKKRGFPWVLYARKLRNNRF